MLSERVYWVILIVCLGVFILADLQWIMPNIRDVGVNLLTDALFAIFTIVFLSWIIKSREIRQWKIVENKIRARIAGHLNRIFDEIYLYFLEPAPTFPDYLERQVEQAEKMRTGIEREKRLNALFIEYYANEKIITLAEESGKEYLKEPDVEATKLYIRDFGNEIVFLEHIIANYARFLPSDLMRSIMEIEDGLEGIVKALQGLEVGICFIMDGDWDRYDHFSRVAESLLVGAIHKIAQELDKLNKMGLGFYPIKY